MIPHARAGSIMKLVRPKQWLKNGIVALSPLMAGTLLEPTVFLDTVVGVVAFIFASSAIYVFNDLRDADADRQHPKKRHRPIASGAVTPSLAWSLSILLAVLAVVTGIWLGSTEFALVIVAYLFLQVLYTLWLKHTPLIDITLISSGFLLRAIAGGVVSEAGVSSWFLLVVGFGSFYIAAAKRYSELVELDDTSSRSPARRVLSGYSLTYLQTLMAASIAAVIGFYSLWAASLNVDEGVIWPLLSILPITLALFRYQYHADRGRAESPEDVVTEDKLFLGFAAVWLVVTISGLYLPPLSVFAV